MKPGRSYAARGSDQNAPGKQQTNRRGDARAEPDEALPGEAKPNRAFPSQDRTVRAPIEARAQAAGVRSQEFFGLVTGHGRKVVNIEIAPGAMALCVIAGHLFPPDRAGRRDLNLVQTEGNGPAHRTPFLGTGTGAAGGKGAGAMHTSPMIILPIGGGGVGESHSRSVTNGSRFRSRA